MAVGLQLAGKNDFVKVQEDINDNLIKLDEAIDFNLLATLGIEYGGILNSTGAKVAGKAYYDTTGKKLYKCIANTSINYADAGFFEALSNNDLLGKLQNLYNSVTNFDSISNDGKIRISGVYNEIFKTMILRIYSTSGDFTIDSKGILCTFGINIPSFVNTDFCINDGGSGFGNIGSKTGFLNIKHIDNNRIELSVAMAAITSPIFLRGTVTLQLT